VADLNGDGTGDVIIGAGRTEFHPCDSAVIAINGVNGEMLWHVAAVDHVYTSAALRDLTGDNVQDIIMGGRSAELMALDGRTGEVLWRFDKKSDGIKWFNFYNAQFVRDLDDDGIEDIIVSNGGNVMAEPYDTKLRYPGNLVVLSSKTGNMLARAPMPDGKETYMSVVVAPMPGSDDYMVVFGSGGETIGGNLYASTLSQVLTGNLSNAVVLDSSPKKGYIGPPLLIDMNNDGSLDIIANAVEGKMIAFDGVTKKRIWTVSVADSEAYSSIAPGYFTGNDDTPDFFVSYAIGQWPDLGWSRQFMINGATGKVAYEDSLGSYQTSSPVVIDLNNDGIDEAILNVNVVTYDFLNTSSFHNILAVMDFKEGQVVQLWDGFPGSNLASTPWIGDLDNDGMLDVVYCHGTSTKKTYSFDGLQAHRIDTGIPISGTSIRWGAYMGSRYNGVFDRIRR
jgi:outer membrane protein assembly factor BamB